MIELELTFKERQRILRYIQHAIEQTHFGGGAVETPEEKLLINTFKKENGRIEVSFRQFKLIAEFAFEATKSGVALLRDEEILLKKLLNALEGYYIH
ncbi:hypothetical protein K1X84_04120 [bacterium]|nr:hypothetical protein [bacterium]